jgi:hypothetical protein
MLIDIDDDAGIEQALGEQLSRMPDEAVVKLARDFGVSAEEVPVVENSPVVASALAFQKIFSMEKVKNPNDNLPLYLHNAVATMPYTPDTEGWYGDSSIAEDCKKLAFFFRANGADNFFVFGGEKLKSLKEFPSGGGFQFRGLLVYLVDSGQWFSGYFYHKNLQEVIDAVKRGDVVSKFWLAETDVHNTRLLVSNKWVEDELKGNQYMCSLGRSMRASSLAFEKFFSMAKIKNEQSVPNYIQQAMGGIVWDGWMGDVSDGTKCNKIACLYSVGPNDNVDEIHFYFCFGREENPSEQDTFAEPYLQFCALVANYKGEWLGKEFSCSDLKSVKEIVNKEEQNAASVLGLVPVNIGYQAIVSEQTRILVVEDVAEALVDKGIVPDKVDAVVVMDELHSLYEDISKLDKYTEEQFVNDVRSTMVGIIRVRGPDSTGSALMKEKKQIPFDPVALDAEVAEAIRLSKRLSAIAASERHSVSSEHSRMVVIKGVAEALVDKGMASDKVDAVVVMDELRSLYENPPKLNEFTKVWFVNDVQSTMAGLIMTRG